MNHRTLAMLLLLGGAAFLLGATTDEIIARRVQANSIVATNDLQARYARITETITAQRLDMPGGLSVPFVRAESGNAHLGGYNVPGLTAHGLIVSDAAGRPRAIIGLVTSQQTGGVAREGILLIDEQGRPRFINGLAPTPPPAAGSVPREQVQ